MLLINSMSEAGRIRIGIARPIVMPDGSIVARPMMYVALSYDHRIIDGRESVTFLVKVKEAIEDPPDEP